MGCGEMAWQGMKLGTVNKPFKIFCQAGEYNNSSQFFENQWRLCGINRDESVGHHAECVYVDGNDLGEREKLTQMKWMDGRRRG